MSNRSLLTLTIKNSSGAIVGHISLEETPADNHGPENHSRADEITEAQRRLLFRLASRLGFEGPTAREYIDRRLGPTKDRRSASRLIDELRAEVTREIGAGHAGAA